MSQTQEVPSDPLQPPHGEKILFKQEDAPAEAALSE